MSETVARRKCLTERFCEAAGQSGRAVHADLLAENCARRELEAVPAARNAKSGNSGDALGQGSVGLEASHDILPICIEIKHGAYALDDEEERTRIAKLNTHGEPVMRVGQGNFKIAVASVQRDRPPITAGIDHFDAWRGTRRQKSQHLLPRVGRTEAKAEEVFIFWLDSLLVCKCPDLAWCPMVDLADGGVKAPHATEAGSYGDLRHREARFINEFFCEMQAASLSDSAGRCSEVPEKQPAEMPRANSQVVCERFYAAVFEAIFSDQPQGPRDGVRSSKPGGCSG